MTPGRKNLTAQDIIRRQSVAKEADGYQRSTALANVYQTADRIITGRRVKVTTGNVADKPAAWSRDDEIVLNTARLDSLTDANIATMTGANFHELSHVLFTPRLGSMIADACSGDLHQAFNILEDSRIERLMIARHPSMKGFLVHVITSIILTKGELSTSWPLIAGRTYLPAKARAAVKAAYVGEGGDEIERVAQAYARLAFPTDDATGLDLVRKFHDLLKDDDDEPPQTECTDRSAPRSGRAESGREQADLQRWAADDEDTAAKEEEKATAKAAAKANDDESDGESDDENESEEEEEQTSSPVRAAEEALKRAQTDSRNSASVRASINDTRRQLTHSGNQASRVFRNEVPTFQPFDTVSLALTRKVGSEMLRLIETHEPGWEIEQPGGRLNMARVMAGRDFGEVFDRWDQGEEGVSLEVVLLVDSSWSMNGRPIELASNAAGVLQRGLSSAGVVVSTYMFSDALSNVYTRGEQPRQIRALFADSGTYASQGLVESYRVLHASEAHRKLVVMLTDGDLGDALKSNDAIGLLQSDGVTVAVAYAGYSVVDQQACRDRYGHGADVFEAMEKASDLIGFTRVVVTQMLRTVVR